MEVNVRPPTEVDVLELAYNLRESDRLELDALLGPGADIEGLIWSATLTSDFSSVVTIDGHVVFVGGVGSTSLLSGEGRPWLLGTAEADKYKGALMRLAKRYLPLVTARYPSLSNFVDARNVKAIKWLKHLGFTIDPPEPYGALGLPFHKFHLEP